MTAKENLVKAPERRVRRSPLDRVNKLTVKGKDPNYEYRIVNDIDDRVNDFIDRGYEFDVDEDIRVGDSRIETISKFGRVRAISVGGGMKAYLMRIKKEWYDEDQEVKMKYVDSTEAAMRSNPNDGTYGKIDVTRK